MKLLIVETASDGSLQAVPGADSAMLRPGEPVFVPDPAGAWRSRVMPAVRVSRLGMHINARNARLYFDAISAFHVMTPMNPMPGIPIGFIDRTFSPGSFLPAAPPQDAVERTLVVSRAPIGSPAADVLTTSFSVDSIGAAATLSEISQWCTLKTGDVLLFADAAIDLGTPVLDTAIEAKIDDTPVLNIRIK